MRDPSVYAAHFKHFNEFFGNVRVRDIGVFQLRAYKDHGLKSKTKDGTNVSLSTVNRETSTLRAVLNEAKVIDWIAVIPFSKARQCELITSREQLVDRLVSIARPKTLREF